MSLGGVLVHAPVVLGAGAQALILFAVNADVDGQHAQIVVAHSLDLVIGPGAVLIEHGLAVGELVGGVVAGLGGQLLGRAGGIGDVQIPDVLVVVKIGALDGVGGGRCRRPCTHSRWAGWPGGS
jgi:hypothetical protein